MPITFREVKNYREKVIRSRRRKRFAITFGFLIVAILVPTLFLLKQDSLILEDFSFMSPSPTPIPIKTIKHYFVPVVNFKDTRNAVTLTELKTAQLVTISENVDIFLDGYQADVVSLDIFPSQLVGNTIGILKVDQVTPNLKTLSLDGSYIWDKNVDLENYSLTFVEKIPGESGNIVEYDAKQLHNIFVGGEIIPARAVDRLGLNVTNNYTYLYDNVRQMIEGADLAIAQLENPLMGNPTPCTGCVVFVGCKRTF